MNNQPYNSAEDTMKHISRVQELLALCITELHQRGVRHDESKLVEPEKSAFDHCIPKLKDFAYGSDEYRACLREMKPALEHHYSRNSHHPEHYPNGVEGMCLFDLLEMLMDWKAASERMKNGGDIRESLRINTERFKLSPQTVAFLNNTINRMSW